MIKFSLLNFTLATSIFVVNSLCRFNREENLNYYSGLNSFWYQNKIFLFNDGAKVCLIFIHKLYFFSSGKPALISSLSCLAPSCLQERRSDLCRELEPLRICDLLLEERAVDIVDHDKITETKGRRNQSQRLIEILEENNNDCFHYFLHILYEKNYATILKILESPTVRSVDDGKLN